MAVLAVSHVRNCDPEEPGADEMCAFTESVTQLMVFAIHAKYGSSSWIPPVISIEGRRKSACIATFEKKSPRHGTIQGKGIFCLMDWIKKGWM